MANVKTIDQIFNYAREALYPLTEDRVENLSPETKKLIKKVTGYSSNLAGAGREELLRTRAKKLMPNDPKFQKLCDWSHIRSEQKHSSLLFDTYEHIKKLNEKSEDLDINEFFDFVGYTYFFNAAHKTMQKEFSEHFRLVSSERGSQELNLNYYDTHQNVWLIIPEQDIDMVTEKPFNNDWLNAQFDKLGKENINEEIIRRGGNVYSHYSAGDNFRSLIARYTTIAENYCKLGYDYDQPIAYQVPETVRAQFNHLSMLMYDLAQSIRPQEHKEIINFIQNECRVGSEQEKNEILDMFRYNMNMKHLSTVPEIL